MQLYGYWRSSAAYRVRIALNLKGIAYQDMPVHLVKDGGEQHQEDYVALNPNHLVPTLVDGEFSLNQSVAIIEYLEEHYPQVPLYPTSIEKKAKVKALALDVACEIHPINNLRVQQYLVNELGVSQEQKLAWSHHWMALGFAAIEIQLAQTAGSCCFGDTPTMADICLVPQVYNARRFGLEMTAYPTICKVVEHLNSLKPFIDALPENQPDAQ